ncbi:hypothetical protein QBC43DRAFT_91007 [Cladorrhinum sp. PSN259]|nr:hypothetical protein QBC43DRAFT_91007 [Cladorrhinum sp. PSN259]
MQKERDGSRRGRRVRGVDDWARRLECEREKEEGTEKSARKKWSAGESGTSGWSGQRARASTSGVREWSIRANCLHFCELLGGSATTKIPSSQRSWQKKRGKKICSFILAGGAALCQLLSLSSCLFAWNGFYWENTATTASNMAIAFCMFYLIPSEGIWDDRAISGYRKQKQQTAKFGRSSASASHRVFTVQLLLFLKIDWI